MKTKPTTSKPNPARGFTLIELLVVIAIIAILVIFHQTGKNKKIVQTGLVLVFSGAIGNLIDRVLHKEVIDFIDFFIDNQHWPAFNIADIAITLGIILLIFATYMSFKFNVKENQ